MLTVNQALEKILNSAKPTTDTETLSIDKALGRTLAHDQISTVDVPPADNSAMDGYAINTQDLSTTNTFNISQTIPAGTTPLPLTPLTAARIFTGAEIPSGANAVVMQERCELIENKVTIPANIPEFNNIRPLGQDIKYGDTILKKGCFLEPQHLGLLASIGINSVAVFKPLTVAILSTGDELIEPGKTLGPGQIYNSNRYQLKGLLNKLGVTIIDFGVVQDALAATKDALEKASQYDCIISTGGVSVGEEDHIKTAVDELGSLTLWRIALKPGKPLAFGHVANTPFFGLPGNPVSTFLTYLLFVRPYLLTYQGQHYQAPEPRSAIAEFSSKANPKRQEYVRVKLEGKRALSFHNQSSGVLSSVVNSNAFAIIPTNTAIHPGDTIDVIPYSELF